MILGTVTKQPAETFSRFIDFVRRLDSSETLTGVGVTATDAASGSDTTAVVVSQPAISGTKGQARLSAGVTADNHVIQVRVTTSLGNTYEDEFLLLIREE
jgi:hypothetical protein